MHLLSGRMRQLVAQIEVFLDTVSQGAIVFHRGVSDYLSHSAADFQCRLEAIDELESRADNIRREVENQLYSNSLIPENRGDVLALLETLDDVIDTAKRTLCEFSVESPEIPAELNDGYRALAEASMHAAESAVLATRAFFRDVRSVKDHLHKVKFYEREADRIGEKVKRQVFGLPLDLSHKIHLRYFALHVGQLSDAAERVADRLAIYSIKRTL